MAELEAAPPHRLTADHNATRSQQLVRVPQAQGKADVEPGRVADDLGREPVSGVAGRRRRCHPSGSLARSALNNPSTMLTVLKQEYSPKYEKQSDSRPNGP